MDTKERWLIEQVRYKLDAGTFSERDVLQLLILLRPHAKPYPVVLEFADFVAHRQRDRGELYERLCRFQTTLEAEGIANGQPVERPLITSNDIHNQFNRLFSNHGFSPIDAELGNRLAVCIITLLQSVNVETPLNASRLRLLVQMSSLKIALIGLGIGPSGHIFTFPLLIADNNGYEPSLAMASPPVGSLLGGDLLVEAYCQRGVFRVEQRARKA